MRDYGKMTEHHVIAKARGGTYHPDNLILIERVPHDSVHLLFDNDLPLEIIRGVLNRFERTMNPEVYNILSYTLKRVEHILEAYNPNCFDAEILKRTIGQTKSR